MDNTPVEHYPPAPWRLSGSSIQAVRLVDSKIARGHVPADLRIVPVWPGKTLAVLYCARYEPPSVLGYHELVVAPALVAAGGRIGFWISQIYVDNPLSRAGGRDIWGLPKELASFVWAPHRREIAVRSEEQTLCTMRWSSRGRLEPGEVEVPVPLYLPVIARGAAGFQFFSGRGSLAVVRLGGEILIDPGSPLASLGFESARTLISGRRLRLRVGAPRPLD